MALANFFEKVSLGASQILSNYSNEKFKEILLNQRVAITFADNACTSSEGKIALELLVRLVARLYPNLQFVNLSKQHSYHTSLESIATAINPKINLSSQRKPTINLIAGLVEEENLEGKKFYFGSDGWLSRFSISKPQEFANSKIPFGASASVCFASSNLFRYVFRDNLPFGQVDNDFTFSVLTLEKDPKENLMVDISTVNIGEINLVGLGAIGNGVIWILKLLNLKGHLNLIDKETVELSNLQRYVLCDQASLKKAKVHLMKDQLSQSRLKVNPLENTWKEYLANRGDFNIEKVAVCVDSAEDRIAIQGSLPKQILNSWTQLEAVGVSRHFDFTRDPCVSCLYLPESKKPNKSEIIAESLGISEHERVVRDYLAEEKKVDNALLQLIREAKGIDIDALSEFDSLYLEEFYSKAACGGILMQLSGENGSPSIEEVPSAFESVMAGILLASEMVIQSVGDVKRSVGHISRLNMMRPISNYINEKGSKHSSGKCICQDPVYKDVYKSKWFNS